MTPPELSDLEAARDQIAGAAVLTPLIRSDALDDHLGARAFVKAECLQRTGSFKFRGAYNRISRLTAEERIRGVVAYSSGNHAQGVAAAARLLGVAATIVMPSDAPALKIQNTQTLGAEVILYDRAREVREEIAAAVQKRTDAILVPPFEDPLVIAGQGTVGLECVSQLAAAGDAADVLVCPTSGGGLMAGSAIAFSALSPGTRLFAVEPEGFDDTARSLRTGRRVSNPATSGSLCDALLTPQPGALTFAINQPRLAGAAAVSDEEALEAVSFAFRHLKLVLEPGGAVGLAAVLRRRVAVSGGCVLIIASGGNVDPAVFARAILPRPSN